MTLSSVMSDDVDMLFSERGQSVTYAGAAVTAIVYYGENLDEESGTRRAKASVRVKVSDVANPAYRDAIVIDSVTWYVDHIVSGNAFVWTLECYQGERPVLA